MPARERVLVLKELLERHTDEENELPLSDIVHLLEEKFMEYEFSKKAIKEDMNMFETSNVIDLIVNQVANGLPKYYSYQNRLFEIQELRLMIDAVVSARFITKKEKEDLISKIKQLTSCKMAARLENQIYIQDNAHSESNKSRFTIYNLHHAIDNQNVIEFQYGRYNVDKEFILSRNGKIYNLHPYALVWNHEYYYLIGWFPEAGELRHYRIDRMVNVRMTEEHFKKSSDFDPSRYTQQVFHMFAGTEEWIEIRFSNKLINVIIDRFGKSVPIRQDGADHFILRTKAVISDGLFHWLMTWGSEAEVLNPPELKEKVKQESERLYRMYHGGRAGLHT